MKGTPTIRLFKPKQKKNRFNRKKIVLDYNYERKKKDMKRFIDANLANHVEKIKDMSSLEKFVDKADRHGLPKALVFSKSKSTTPLLKYASTEYRRRMLIGLVKMTKNTESISSKFGISDLPAMLVLKQNDEVVKYTKKGFSFHKVVNFLGEHALKKPVLGKAKKEQKKGKASTGTDTTDADVSKDEM